MEICAASGRLQPGFRFHPTNVELVMYYLKKKVLRKGLRQDMIAEVYVYKFHPQDLRDLACLKKDLNWYFFCLRGKKYGSGERTNRATDSGYWKATGNDRIVAYEERTVGKIKTLVFHEGKPPKGTRTDWVMHEYRLDDKKLADEGVWQDSYVLCKIFQKSGWGPKNAEQYGAPFVEAEWEDEDEDEIINNAQVVQHIGDHYQTTSGVTDSAVTNVFVSENAYSDFTFEQVNSGAVSVSDYDVDQMFTEFPPVSPTTGPLLNYNLPVVEGSTSMPAPADIASTSAVVVRTNDDDEMDRLLNIFVVGDQMDDVFEGLGDLGHSEFTQGIDSSCWADFDDSGFSLSELNEPL